MRLPALLCALALAFGEPAPGQPADTVLANQPARHSPEWLKSGVIYEIYLRSFSPAGNLKGVTARLDDLQKLGVSILWLMPIHPNGQVKKKGTLGSPYAVRDYYAIDPQYGTKDDLKELVQQAHQRGLKVIIDIVANHTAWDSVMMAHPEFYKHGADGQIVSPYDWTDVAALNYANPKLRQYMKDMLVYWIKNFDLDGYRCDAAAEVPTDFWEEARAELDRAKPGIMMLAEASKPELLRSAFDIDYSWPLLSTLNKVIMQGEPASAVRDTIEEQKRMFPNGALHMRISDDHDEERAIARYGTPGALTASGLVFTLDGVPLLYNGMEVGDQTESGGPALFEPLKILWQMAERRPQFPKFYAATVPFRKAHAAFIDGELQWVGNSDQQHIVSFIRRSGAESFLVTANLSNTPFHGALQGLEGQWKPVDAPALGAGSELPNLSLDAFGLRIYERQ